ncbi:MAG: zeta toxin family protein [Methylocystaceae bacterium]|nr:zeta toxin family protein [Methylocystaceae bacterium]
MRNKTPELWIVAGPNGAGKSTVVAKQNKAGLPVVNPDVIAATLTGQSETQKHVIAGRQALGLQQHFLSEGKSFIVETTFSGRAGFNLVEKAKSRGYQINLVFVALKSFRQSQGRVFTRTSDGGHNVSTVDIKRRFDRVTDNIAMILPKVDRAFVLDNTRRAPLLVAKLKKGKLVRKYPTLDKWLKDRFPVLKRTRSQSLSH